MKKALTIAGSDCSGGAGIQADLKTFSAHGVFGMSVVTSVVAENTVRVISYQDITPQIIQEQVDAVFEDIKPDAVKIGMLSTVETMQAVAASLKKWQPEKVVLDPVMYAKNGCALMDPTSIDTLIEAVLPLANLITPNIPEAEKISGLSIQSLEDMEIAAKKSMTYVVPQLWLKVDTKSAKPPMFYMLVKDFLNTLANGLIPKILTALAVPSLLLLRHN